MHLINFNVQSRDSRARLRMRLATMKVKMELMKERDESKKKDLRR